MRTQDDVAADRAKVEANKQRARDNAQNTINTLQRAERIALDEIARLQERERKLFLGIAVANDKKNLVGVQDNFAAMFQLRALELPNLLNVEVRSSDWKGASAFAFANYHSEVTSQLIDGINPHIPQVRTLRSKLNEALTAFAIGATNLEQRLMQVKAERQDAQIGLQTLQGELSNARAALANIG